MSKKDNIKESNVLESEQGQNVPESFKTILNNSGYKVCSDKSSSRDKQAKRELKNSTRAQEIQINRNIILKIVDSIQHSRAQLIAEYLHQAAAVTSVKDLKNVFNGGLGAPKRMAAILGSAAAEFGYLIARYNQMVNKASNLSFYSLQGSQQVTMTGHVDKDYIQRVCVAAYAIIARAININTPYLNIYEHLVYGVTEGQQGSIPEKDNKALLFLKQAIIVKKGKVTDHFRHTLQALGACYIHNIFIEGNELSDHLSLLYDIQHPAVEHLKHAMLILIEGANTLNQLNSGSAAFKAIENVLKAPSAKTMAILKDTEAKALLLNIINSSYQRNEESVKAAENSILEIVTRLPHKESAINGVWKLRVNNSLDSVNEGSSGLNAIEGLNRNMDQSKQEQGGRKAPTLSITSKSKVEQSNLTSGQTGLSKTQSADSLNEVDKNKKITDEFLREFCAKNSHSLAYRQKQQSLSRAQSEGSLNELNQGGLAKNITDALAQTHDSAGAQSFVPRALPPIPKSTAQTHNSGGAQSKTFFGELNEVLKRRQGLASGQTHNSGGTKPVVPPRPKEIVLVNEENSSVASEATPSPRP